jgi:hypothetical protein
MERETLRHNPLNAVTATVERITEPDGRTVIRKELREPVEFDGPWAGSRDPRHWNYWRREIEVYRDEKLRDQLRGTGLYLAEVEIEEIGGGAVLHLEDIAGLQGTEFGLEDHAALSRAVGRWQAKPAEVEPWTSVGFLRDYSTTRDVRWELLDDDAAWEQPLIADHWPEGLRAAWTSLVAHREELLKLVEGLPRSRCHLDLWVSNAIRRPSGEIALLDWAFTGDGALGEDLGNHIPDAALDLFWPADRLPELAETCIENYLEGLREGGWRGDPEQVRLAVLASAVKYAWLVPGLLARAAEPSHQAYHQQADSQHLFHQRGIALAYLADSCARAIG